MNDDQQPNQDKPEGMTSPWPEASNEQASEQAQSDDASSADVTSSMHDESLATDASPRGIQSSVVPPQPESPTPVAPVVGQPLAPTAPPVENPGQALGIASIILGVLTLWLVGLPLAIVSMVKSSKAQASKTLGIVGLVLNIVAIFITSFIFIVILMALPALQEAAQEAQAAANSAAVISETTIPLSMEYKPANTEASFVVPASYAGWTATTVEKEGINEFTKNDDSATFMTYHGVLAGLSGTDMEVTKQAMADYIMQLDAIEVADSESTVSFPTTSDGKMLQFETRQVTAISNSNAIKGIVAVRMYEGHELSVIYLASADTFSMSEWSSLISEVKINDKAL